MGKDDDQIRQGHKFSGPSPELPPLQAEWWVLGALVRARFFVEPSDFETEGLILQGAYAPLGLPGQVVIRGGAAVPRPHVRDLLDLLLRSRAVQRTWALNCARMLTTAIEGRSTIDSQSAYWLPATGVLEEIADLAHGGSALGPEDPARRILAWSIANGHAATPELKQTAWHGALILTGVPFRAPYMDPPETAFEGEPEEDAPLFPPVEDPQRIPDGLHRDGVLLRVESRGRRVSFTFGTTSDALLALCALLSNVKVEIEDDSGSEPADG